MTNPSICYKIWATNTDTETHNDNDAINGMFMALLHKSDNKKIILLPSCGFVLF